MNKEFEAGQQIEIARNLATGIKDAIFESPEFNAALEERANLLGKSTEETLILGASFLRGSYRYDYIESRFGEGISIRRYPIENKDKVIHHEFIDIEIDPSSTIRKREGKFRYMEFNPSFPPDIESNTKDAADKISSFIKELRKDGMPPTSH